LSVRKCGGIIRGAEPEPPGAGVGAFQKTRGSGSGEKTVIQKLDKFKNQTLGAGIALASILIHLLINTNE